MKKYQWVVEITVDETWIADGWDLTEERLSDMISSQLRYAYSHEYSGKILKKPTKRELNKARNA